MSDLLQSLKTEITRLSRKEIKAAITPLQNSNAKLRKTVAELKARIGELESAKSGREQKPEVAAPEQLARLRISSKVIFNLRKKLGLSREAFAKLLGISAQNVFAMEHKEGRLKMRAATLSKYLAVKGLGKRAALKKLESK